MLSRAREHGVLWLMKDHLDEHTLFNTVAMQCKATGKMALVVEGKTDYLLLYRPFGGHILLKHATGGKTQVLQAAKLALDRNFDSIRFLVDRDYDNYREAKSYGSNVLVSVSHDCVIDVVARARDDLHHVICVRVARVSPRFSDESCVPEDIAREAYDLCARFSATRIVAARRSLDLRLSEFKFGGLKKCQLSPEEIANQALVRSRYQGDDRERIVQESLKEYERIRISPLLEIGDHDFFDALAYVLNERCRVKVKGDDLQYDVLGAISSKAVFETQWCKEIMAWLKRSGFGSDLLLRGFDHNEEVSRNVSCSGGTDGA
ncbi:hypothetical protein [Buchananella hordeovulneris]|uniref:hypothetical protein n=1 Tax=Buchananella hordeovulneris TaxID=52770 RepID=UPI001161327F|nr:hypothetical protein [Buchananella hordeovulneris]